MIPRRASRFATALLAVAIALAGCSRESGSGQTPSGPSGGGALGPVRRGLPNAPGVASATIPEDCPLVAPAGPESFYVVSCGEYREATGIRNDVSTIWITTTPDPRAAAGGAAAVGVVTTTTVSLPSTVDRTKPITVIVDGSVRTLTL